MCESILMDFSWHFLSAKRSSSLSHLCVVLHVGLSAKFTKILGMLGPHPQSVTDGLFRQSLNGTGNGNGSLINTNGFLSHCNWTGNLGNGFQTHLGTYMVTLQGNLWCLVQ